MTTTIGTQFKPYVEEETSTKEQEAVPCDFYHKSLDNGEWTPASPHQGDPCPNEATHTGICMHGDYSINACEECVNHFTSGGLRGNPNGPAHLFRKKFCNHLNTSGSKNLVWFPR